MAKWMSTRGARNIVLVSRSGSMNDKLDALIREPASHKTHILVKACDVSSRADVERLLNEELTHLPPVRGVVHGAMILRVSSLTIISLSQAAARLIGNL